MTKKQLIFFVPFLLFIFSCVGKKPADANKPLFDSLANECYSLSLALQTDSLRMLAEKYIKLTPENSEEYYNARQYYISSYFNARNFDKVFALLDETEKMPRFNDYPAVVCRYLYTRGRSLQYTGRSAEAIDVFKRCMTFDCKEEFQEKVASTVLMAMTQLMNTYISSGNMESGYKFFLQVKNSPTPVIQRFALRDLYSHLGHIAMQADHLKEAYRITDSVFILPLYNPTPEKMFKYYAYAATVFYSDPNPHAKERVIKWLNQAIDQANKSDDPSGLEWSINTLASIYWSQNRVEEGTELQYQALKMAQKRGDKRAEWACYTSLSTLYRNWELYSQANEYADQAISVILPTNHYQFQGNAFQTKAAIMQAIGKPDSAIYYYLKSKEYLAKTQDPYSKRYTESGIAEILIDYCSGDSLAMGVKIMRNVLRKMNMNERRGYNFYCLGKGLIKQGQMSEGEAMLDSMYAEVSQTKDATYRDGVLEYIIDHYLKRGNQAKVVQYAHLYRKQTDIRYNEKISRKVASAMIEYQTEKKEQQLKLAKAELVVKDLKIKLYIILVILLVFILIGGVLWYFHKRKLQRNRQLLAEQEKLIALRERELAESRLHEQEILLESALENLREANLQSEQVTEQLNEFISDRENKLSIVSIAPSMLREKGEVKFRRYFAQLYPSFLISLKEQIPDITRGEEILSMLIALGQNIDEAADILCIEKKSVKMTRYRMRKKINIEKEESLDEFIKSLL